MKPIKAYYNSHKKEYKDVFGAAPCGKTINFRIRLDLLSHYPLSCYLRIWEDGGGEKLIPMTGYDNKDKRDSFVFEGTYTLPQKPGLTWYYFKIDFMGQTLYYGNNQDLLGGEGELFDYEPPSYQITVYDPKRVPAWYREGVMYQIFPDRFCRKDQTFKKTRGKEKALFHLDWYDNPFYIKEEDGSIERWNFFGGNLAGVIEKLDYLRELGISIIYLNPIFEARSNHRYDTGDYMKIDPILGDEKTFKSLVDEGKKRGISIILDGVFSHTGAYSRYFNKDGDYEGQGAYESKKSPYYSWYRFEEYPHKYETWWGVLNMPNVDELNPSYKEFIYGGGESVIGHWMAMGVKGWRLDVADELPKEFIEGLRIRVKKEDEEAIILGEVWEDATNKVSYGELREYLLGGELDSVTNYPLRRIWLDFILGKINSQVVHKKTMSLYENYPREAFYSSMNLIGGHDRMRILTRLGDAPKGDTLKDREKEDFRLRNESKKIAIKRLKLISLMQFCFPGVPCLYYGDEAGLEGYTDPYNRGTYPWGREDKEILSWYKKIIGLRNKYQVLKSGDFKSLYEGEDLYGFIRYNEKEGILILVNRSQKRSWKGNLRSLLEEDLFQTKALKTFDLLGNEEAFRGEEIEVKALSFRVLYMLI